MSDIAFETNTPIKAGRDLFQYYNGPGWPVPSKMIKNCDKVLL